MCMDYTCWPRKIMKWSWDTAKSEASLPLHRPPPRSPRAQRFHTFCPRRCSFGMSQLKVLVNQFLKRWRGNEFCWFLVVCQIATLWWFDHSSPYCPFVVVIMIETHFFFHRTAYSAYHLSQDLADGKCWTQQSQFRSDPQKLARHSAEASRNCMNHSWSAACIESLHCQALTTICVLAVWCDLGKCC